MKTLLNDKLNILKQISFSDHSTIELIIQIEELLKKEDNIDTLQYYEAISMIGYYFGKTHHYDKSQYWLNKLPYNKNNHNWFVFKQLLFPIIHSTKEEFQIIETFKKNIDFLIDMEYIYISNLLILDHSFWYGYIDINPKELYEKYAELQIKAFPSIYSQQIIKYNKNNKIKIGILSAGLMPIYNKDVFNIHSSSISDSFYSTFLNLSNELFEVIFIYYGKNKVLNDNKNIYIPKINPVVEDVKKVQAKIASQHLDILLYLDLHIEPMLNFIALSKLAKIQICTHGHPVTSGIPRHIMNYFISWEAAEIKDAQEHYTEELVLISKNVVWEHYIPRNSTDNVSLLTGIEWGHMKRPDLSYLPKNVNYNKNWYFCAQTSFKFNFRFDYILKQILHKDKNAIIFLIKNNKDCYSLHSHLVKRLLENGVDLDRIIFLEKMAHHDMMALYNNIDVALDSFFFGGDTTSREALEIGTPIITLPYKYLGSRWTQAYYNHIGVTELIAKNVDDYIDLTIKVGTNKLYSNELKRKIKNKIHTLFHNKMASKSWENVFLDLYNKEKHKFIQTNIPTDPRRNSKCFSGTELMVQRITDMIDISHLNIITNPLEQTINNKPTIYWCHDNPCDRRYKNIDTTRLFIFVSEYQKNKFIKYFNIENYIIIHNGIVPFPKHTKQHSICKLIYHSTPHRGLDILIEVFNKLVPYFMNIGIRIHLDVYSSFKIYDNLELDKCYQHLYDKIKNNPYMTYYGTVENNVIRKALMGAHIFAYPSTFEETSCLCLIEAMSAGCICVHSSLGALGETSNGLTYMYEYTDDKMEHCNRFAETLIKAVLNYKDISLEKQINYTNKTFNISTILDKWKDFILHVDNVS